MDDRLDCVIVGGGIIGIAIGRRLAKQGRQVVVLEAESAIGMHTSSRNSEVIHAGIYYPPDSMKARMCVEGKEALYAYCGQRGVPCERVGKLILATEEDEEPMLERYAANAKANGVTDLRFLSRKQAAALEPAVSAVSALYSPSTGIIDTHAFMLALQADLEAEGGMVLCQSRVSYVEAGSSGFAVTLEEEAYSFECNVLVNATGLWASELGRRIRGLDPAFVPATRYAKGHYFVLSGRSPFSHLVYPVAGKEGLGVHITLDLEGRVRFGPDVEWVEVVDYGFDESRRSDFINAIMRYFPELRPDKLTAGYTGVRPKLVGPGESPADFMIQGPETHGIPGLVNLFGIESPGLTAAFSIADHAAGKLS